jgi:hypothetical protein
MQADERRDGTVARRSQLISVLCGRWAREKLERDVTRGVM